MNRLTLTALTLIGCAIAACCPPAGQEPTPASSERDNDNATTANVDAVDHDGASANDASANDARVNAGSENADNTVHGDADDDPGDVETPPLRALETTATVTGDPISPGGPGLLVRIKAQGPARDVATAAAREAAVRACFEREIGADWMNMVAAHSEWPALVQTNTDFDVRPRFTMADDTVYAADSCYVECIVHVMTSPIREWLEQLGGPFGGDGAASVPLPALCVVCTTQSGRWLEAEQLEAFQVVAERHIVDVLRDHNVEVVRYAEEIAAIRAQLEPGRSLNERHSLRANVFVEYSVLHEQRPRDFRKYSCTMQAVANLTDEIWATATGYSDDVNVESVGVEQACRTAAESLWPDLIAAWRVAREPGLLHRIICDARDEDGATLVREAVQAVCSKTNVVTASARHIAIDAWVPDKLGDALTLYINLRDHVAAQGRTLKLVQTLGQLVVLTIN